jgi:hypothetical protein
MKQSLLGDAVMIEERRRELDRKKLRVGLLAGAMPASTNATVSKCFLQMEATFLISLAPIQISRSTIVHGSGRTSIR